MKFTANSIELQRTLNKLGSVIPSKSPIPIVENILCELLGDTLTLSATDMAISLTVSFQVHGAGDGKITIPAKRLVDTMRSLPDTAATFTVDLATNRVKITTDNGEYSLIGENAKDFPATPPFAGSTEFSIDSNELSSIIHRTAFAVSTDELRPAMMGVLFQTKDDRLRVVSTDGHRLVRLIHPEAGSPLLKKDILVPVKALTVLTKSMEEGKTTVSVSDTHIRFSYDQASLISRLIDEAYPNYEAVIPTDNNKQMKVKRDALISSIRRVALYANATTHQLRFDIEESKLQVAAQDVDFGGEAKETLPCSFSADRLEIGFNSQYLIDVLTHLDTDEVSFQFSTPTRAGIVAPVPPKHDEGATRDDDILMLVMPVRLNN
jgi:DNA polymerase-3 subunit beta